MDKIILRIAPCVKRYLDYGALMGTEHGVVWCDEDGYPIKNGYEPNKTVQNIKDSFADYSHRVEFVVLPEKGFGVDYNPRGDI